MSQIVQDAPAVPDWAQPAEIVRVELVQAGDVLVFESGNRLVLSSEHGATVFFQLIQIIKFLGDEDDDERRFPWGDFMLRRVDRGREQEL